MREATSTPRRAHQSKEKGPADGEALRNDALAVLAALAIAIALLARLLPALLLLAGLLLAAALLATLLPALLLLAGFRLVLVLLVRVVHTQSPRGILRLG
jgi:hypothetical protein